MATAAYNLARIFQHFLAYLADQFIRNLSDEVVHRFVDAGFVESIVVVHFYDLQRINGGGGWVKLLVGHYLEL